LPRRSRVSTGQYVFHVLNRAVQGVTLFETAADYELFIDLLGEAARHLPIRILAFAIMPNHWHLVLWPHNDYSLSPFMKWLTGTHAMKWRATRGSQGRGAVYQGRFKAIAVQHDAHFLTLCRYVERNPVRARLVARAEEWRWGSAAPATIRPRWPVISAWPVPKPDDWLDRLNVPEPARSLRGIRDAIRAGRHFGSASWRYRTAQALRWRSGLTQRGRPVELPRDQAP
jgi:putative transposase